MPNCYTRGKLRKIPEFGCWGGHELIRDYKTCLRDVTGNLWKSFPQSLFAQQHLDDLTIQNGNTRSNVLSMLVFLARIKKQSEMLILDKEIDRGNILREFINP